MKHILYILIINNVPYVKSDLFVICKTKHTFLPFSAGLEVMHGAQAEVKITKAKPILDLGRLSAETVVNLD